MPATAPANVIDCMSPQTSPVLVPVLLSVAAVPAIAQVPQSPVRHPPPPPPPLSVVTTPQSPVRRPTVNEIEILESSESDSSESEWSSSGSDTETDDEDVPVRALIERRPSRSSTDAAPSAASASTARTKHKKKSKRSKKVPAGGSSASVLRRQSVP